MTDSTDATLGYLIPLIRDLRRLARNAQHDDVAYLLELAEGEARREARRALGGKPDRTE